jgi:hypothetical protein
VSITEFGAVGDGVTLNTHAFENAMFYLRSFADKGGAQLFVPAGRWLTGSFNLTSHLTLNLDKDAVILGSKVIICSVLYDFSLQHPYGSIVNYGQCRLWNDVQRVVAGDYRSLQAPWS